MKKEIINIDAIAREVASANNLTIKASKKIVEDTFTIIASKLNLKSEVYLKDFGTFKVSERLCRQPMTDNKVKSNVITFKSFKKLKSQVK